MNYKIKITAENREAIKEIADRNGINPNELSFGAFGYYYEIINGRFNDWRFKSPINDELTFEQFKAMFDKEDGIEKSLKKEYDLDIIDSDTDNIYLNGLIEGAKSESAKNYWYEKFKEKYMKTETQETDRKRVEIDYTGFPNRPTENNNLQNNDKNNFVCFEETDLEKWLRETKNKNLSLEELQNYISIDRLHLGSTSIYDKLQGANVFEKAEILFNQWNQPKEDFQPKRGDRILVWDDNETDAVERIFLAEIKGIAYPIITVHLGHERNFNENKTFSTDDFKHMKPLPIASTETEKPFKEKVIELIEKRIENQETNIQQYYENKQYYLLNSSNTHKIIYQDLLKEIKSI